MEEQNGYFRGKTTRWGNNAEDGRKELSVTLKCITNTLNRAVEMETQAYFIYLHGI